jgi:hypothetical protein
MLQAVAHELSQHNVDGAVLPLCFMPILHNSHSSSVLFSLSLQICRQRKEEGLDEALLGQGHAIHHLQQEHVLAVSLQRVCNLHGGVQ